MLQIQITQKMYSQKYFRRIKVVPRHLIVGGDAIKNKIRKLLFYS